ncbi:MAG TPA: dual specificity protein phosphatase [Anaerolineales bacterium]|nr:dual specificity protein phosphatase [Anaerolineales bacterium]
MNLSRITDNVLVGTTPGPADFERLHEMGIRLVINMRLLRGRGPDAASPGVQYLRLRTFDNPLLPIPTGALVRGVRAALEVIRDGGSVYTHCSRGRHRSVAMAAAILIALGRSPEEAMVLIKQRRPLADPNATHIRSRILKFETAWRLAQSRESQ